MTTRAAASAVTAAATATTMTKGTWAVARRTTARGGGAASTRQRRCRATARWADFARSSTCPGSSAEASGPRDCWAARRKRAPCFASLETGYNGRDAHPPARPCPARDRPAL